MHLLIHKALYLAFITAFHYKFAMAGTIAPSESASRNMFAADLFSVLADKKSTENIVFSPASIQSCLALAFVGAEGKTAEDMRKVLRLGKGDKAQVMENYGEYIKTTFKRSDISENSTQLTLANRMYVNEGIKVAPQFEQIARDFFDSTTEHVDFENADEAVEKINQWVEEETNHKIKDLVNPKTVDPDTSAILVNAIYFKGKWLNPFSAEDTEKSNFYINNKKQAEVDTMFTNDNFAYAQVPELKATAIEMPYLDSNISMMIILPDEVDGLKELESKLKDLDLNVISSKMIMQEVDVYLPKFRIEFDIDLKDPLVEMGLKTMFDEKANFSSLFDNAEPQKISKVQHKAFLDVNEAGSEAAAATYIKVTLMSFNINKRVFRADHPFAFAIRSKTSVFFAGHVVEF